MEKKGLTLAATVFGALAIASFAWACTGQPQVFLLTPQTGPSGVEVTVAGQMIAQGPVEIRWSGKGISEGLKLADSFAGPNADFSVPVRIPQSAPGVYYITVEAGDRSIARATFEVTGETPVSAGPAGATAGEPRQSRAVSADLWKGFAGESGSSLHNSVDASLNGAGLGQGAVMGLALSAVGAVALGGLSVAAVRRRRALAGRHR